MAYKTKEISNSKSVYQQPPKTSHFYKGFSSVDPANSGSRLYDFEQSAPKLCKHPTRNV